MNQFRLLANPTKDTNCCCDIYAKLARESRGSVVGPHQVGLSTNVSNFEKDDQASVRVTSGVVGTPDNCCEVNPSSGRMLNKFE